MYQFRMLVKVGMLKKHRYNYNVLKYIVFCQLMHV